MRNIRGLLNIFLIKHVFEGKSFAMVSLKLLLVTILQKYQFFADGRIQDLKLCADLSVRLVGGHNVRIKKRE